VAEAATDLRAAVEHLADLLGATDRSRVNAALRLLDADADAALQRKMDAEPGARYLRGVPKPAPNGDAADHWEDGAGKGEDLAERAGRGLRFLRGPEFMAAGSSAPEVLVPRVAYEGCVTACHGRPRSFKSLATGAGAVEVAAGLPWWGVFAPARPLVVGLVLEEDGDKLVRWRYGLMAAGLGLSALPDNLRLLVRAGLNLEAPSERAEFLRHVVAPERLDVLIADPVRSPLPGVDGGPKDGAPLRRFAAEALEVVRSLLLVHHDVKPARDQQDGRARAEQASGGQILSVADVPIGFARLSGRSALVEWSLVKVGADSSPLRLDVEAGTDEEGGFADFLRVRATTAGEEDTQDASSRERVRSCVAAGPWVTASEIATSTAMKRETVDRLLAQMAAARILRAETGAAAKARGRNPNAKLWGPFDE